MADNLLPCPFCSAKEATSPGQTDGVWLEKNDHEDPEYHVECWACGARGLFTYNREAAIAAWNRRPAMEAVAWRVKDYADGWILFHNEAPARKSGEARNGALVQALAVIPTEGLGSSATPIPTCDAETAVLANSGGAQLREEKCWGLI